MRGRLLSYGFYDVCSFLAARTHTECLTLYFQTAVRNQVLNSSCSLVSALIICCHVSMFWRNTTMSNYRHFPGLNRKLSDFKQKNSDQLFSVFLCFLPPSVSIFFFMMNIWKMNRERGKKEGRGNILFYFFPFLRPFPNGLEIKKAKLRVMFADFMFKQLLDMDYSSCVKREKEEKHWNISGCQSRNCSGPDCKITLAITTKC